MNNIDWSKAPEWAVDVRNSPYGIHWTNGKDRVEPIDYSTGQMFGISMSNFTVIETRPTPAQPAIDWSKAPDWAVDVRCSPSKHYCWTNGNDTARVVCPNNFMYDSGKRWTINVKDWSILENCPTINICIETRPTPAQPAIDWSKAPDWAVDVRRSAGGECWTDGIKSFEWLYGVDSRTKYRNDDVKNWPILESRPASVQLVIDWNEAPDWAVDVRNGVHGKCWTDGDVMFVWFNDRDCVFKSDLIQEWPIISVLPSPVFDHIGIRTQLENGTPVPSSETPMPKVKSPEPHNNIERIASLITSWPTSIHSAEALAKANICSNICATWRGSELIRITLDGVTEDEWLEAVTLSEQDMIKLAGRDEMTRDEFVGKCVDLYLEVRPDTPYDTLFGYLYNAGCRFVK